MSAAIVARARACVGAPFRPQGRSVETGLDCVGLALLAFAFEGAPPRYAMRGGDAGAVRAMIEAMGLECVAAIGVGDLMLHAAGAAHLHLSIATGEGLIHACGRIGRVVELRGAPPWPVIGMWRKIGEM
jgi:cell wall-associated NlpC family hydrolase